MYLPKMRRNNLVFLFMLLIAISIFSFVILYKPTQAKSDERNSEELKSTYSVDDGSSLKKLPQSTINDDEYKQSLRQALKKKAASKNFKHELKNKGLIEKEAASNVETKVVPIDERDMQ